VGGHGGAPPNHPPPAPAGRVCLTWGEARVARIADHPPATPIALVPEATVSTAAARAALPPNVPHADAAHTVARAALIGAALASGPAELVAEALDDRLHEPYRASAAPLLAQVRAALPPGALGATLSGSGPSVIVWARDEEAETCAAELARRFAEARVLRLAVAARGAVG
jgi:homoserine kinase